jgi:hypothetical protein
MIKEYPDAFEIEMLWMDPAFVVRDFIIISKAIGNTKKPPKIIRVKMREDPDGSRNVRKK